MADYDISELSSLSGVTRRNIHFYVQQGLLPPAEGAGLGARYTDAHLLRLRAVPLLRARGLRLDQIRERLSRLGYGELEALLADLSRPVPEHPASDGDEEGGQPQAQTLVRYLIAPGIELTVAAAAGAEARARVAELLRACRHIFGGPTSGRPDGGKR